MDNRTETALRASIKHWEDIVKDPVNANIGASNCALCREFHIWFNPEMDATCVGCPVFEFTGDDMCGSTPYYDFEDARDVGASEPELRRIATRELEFLKSFLQGNQCKDA